MSLDRLIRLAQRTGDRLIVHDPVNGQDIVLLDIASYEQLLADKGKEDFVWPGAEESAEEEESPWQSAGDVIEERYGGEVTASPSFVEEMWGALKGERVDRKESEEDAVPKNPLTKEASDEPIFYEEPLG